MSHSFHDDRLLVAGYGVTGRSVENFLQEAGIDVVVCDDDPDSGYQSCQEADISGYEYIFKSPGMHALSEEDDSRIINDVELFFRLSRKPAICITGTNGKSTVVAMVEHILKQCSINALACGNYGVPVLEAYQHNPDVYVIELSSYQIENVRSMVCLSSVVLNVAVDHTDRYRDMIEYQAVKEIIYNDALIKVVPVNDQRILSYDDDISGYRCLQGESDVCLTEYLVQGENIYRNNEVVCNTSSVPVFGKHNMLNVCASLALCEPLGLPRQSTLDAIATFQGLPHRMEYVCKDKSGTVWINDSKSTNVHSLSAALDSVENNVCLIAGGYGKGEEYHEVFDRFSAKISSLILFGREAQNMYEQARSIKDKVIVKDVKDAVTKAADTGGAIVLFSPACASFDLYKDYAERGNDYKSLVRRVSSC